MLFVGVLEDYKGVDVLAEAWRLAAPRVPDAELRLVGRGPKGPIVEELLAELPRQTRWYPSLDQAELLRELDSSSALVLRRAPRGCRGSCSSRSAAAGRSIAARAGGVGRPRRATARTALLVDAEDAEALADAIVDVLLEPVWAEELVGRRRPERERTGSPRPRSSQSGCATSSPP